MPRRTPLTRDRVLDAALGLVDASGIASLTMRSLADELGVTPMSTYRYVAGKEQLLDGLVDTVFAEIDLPLAGADWRFEIHRHAHSVRRVLLAHPWALALLETRTNPGLATLTHHDAVIATLRTGGFSIPLTAQAFALLDAYVYGFVLQEVSLPFDPPGQSGHVAETILNEIPPEAFPNLVELATEHFMQPHFRFGDQFDFGLDLVLDGLEALVATRSGPAPLE